MLSFRDQHDNGTYDLTLRDDSSDPDLLNTREYIFIHDIEYDENTPNEVIATPTA